jgi:hypothetical protein
MKRSRCSRSVTWAGSMLRGDRRAHRRWSGRTGLLAEANARHAAQCPWSGLPGVNWASIFGGHYPQPELAGRLLLRRADSAVLPHAWGHALVGLVKYEWHALDEVADHLPQAFVHSAQTGVPALPRMHFWAGTDPWRRDDSMRQPLLWNDWKRRYSPPPMKSKSRSRMHSACVSRWCVVTWSLHKVFCAPTLGRVRRRRTGARRRSSTRC